jgi:hypothetical protein
MKQSHIRNVVYVDLRFKDDDEGFPVELDGEYRRGKQQFANHGLSLRGGGGINRQSQCDKDSCEPTLVLTICNFLGLD